MLRTVQRTAVAAVMAAAALGLAAGPAQAAQSSITLSVGDQSSPVQSYSWGVSNSGSAHVGGGIGSGKANFGDFSLTKETDAMTPTLVKSAALGTQFPAVAVQFSNGVFTNSYCLKGALVTSVQTGASTNQRRPSDSVSFTFERFSIKVGTEAFGFNLVENSAAGTNPCAT